MVAREEALRSRLTRRALIGGALGAVPLIGCRGRGPEGPYVPDVCIVGSGFAGVHLAHRLLDSGLTVRMLEAGPWLAASDHVDGNRRLFPIDNVGAERYEVVGSRTIGVGGTSRKWGGTLLRLSDDDLRTRSRFGYGEDWPVSTTELEPYYCEAAVALHAVGAPFRPDAEPPRSCPYPHETLSSETPPDVVDAEGGRSLFFSYAQSRRDGAGGPVRLADVEIPALQRRAGFKLEVEAPAVRIEVDESGTASAIEVRSIEGQSRYYRARVFVVAAGVFESARLLMASVCDRYPAGLGNASDALGRYFHAHPVRRLLRSKGAADAIPGGYFRALSLATEFRRDGLLACGHKLFVRQNEVSVNVQPEGEALARNRVAWSKSRQDLFGRPAMALDYRFSEREVRTMQRGVEVAERLIAHFRLGEAIAPVEAVDRKHPSGLCRMSASPASGVVDPDLRVHGIPNLYVVGASVFPSNGIANPTFTVVALALRLAAHLGRRLSA